MCGDVGSAFDYPHLNQLPPQQFTKRNRIVVLDGELNVVDFADCSVHELESRDDSGPATAGPDDNELDPADAFAVKQRDHAIDELSQWQLVIVRVL